jgi:hypothetical protein
MMQSVSDSFASALDEYKMDPALLPHAMRYFVAAWSGDLWPE